MSEPAHAPMGTGWPVREPGAGANHEPPPPPDLPSTARRRGWRGALAMLLLGLAAGGLISFGLTRYAGSGVTEIRVNDTPVKAGAAVAVDVAKRLAPAVATIVATQASSTGLGSGFVIAHDSSASYLVTNNHVVQGATNLHVVMPDGQQFTAHLVGTDALDDIAVVSVPSTSLPQATFGTSARLSAGQSVIAIGSPLGNQGSVTVGVISALHRTIQAGGEAGSSAETLEDVLQTDASINPGNSGGPLADTAGNVVGVNVATAGNANSIGYSIPADLARYVAGTLIKHQKVQHPFLGIKYLSSIDAIEAGSGFSGPGVFVKSVNAGTPAATGGFHAGDILVAINSVEIDNGQTLGGLIQEHKVGDVVVCTVRRGGQTITLNATLAERPGA
ncbi:MAG: trypsin-like peptidase domain-containing protein [Candidatus Dormibacteraeota bacterium]|uniref:Trypsin-like peptidase domain-containing protein n=1 Tax=Candidatus Amunia macphersoniae TaxID=3127014 RepID=A0A934KGP0_9BACT|nr:trypsin-like peptidase domain-containing protein [Candidatus Dormibacteraeota bacterium]